MSVDPLWGVVVFAGLAAWVYLLRQSWLLQGRIESARVRAEKDDAAGIARLHQLEDHRAVLEKTRALLEHVARRSPVGLVVSDESRILWANRAAAEATGVSIDVMTTTPLHALIHPEDRKAAARAVEESVVAGTPIARFRNRWVVPSTGEVVHLQWDATPFADGLAYTTVRRREPSGE